MTDLIPPYPEPDLQLDAADSNMTKTQPWRRLSCPARCAGGGGLSAEPYGGGGSRVRDVMALETSKLWLVSHLEHAGSRIIQRVS